LSPFKVPASGFHVAFTSGRIAVVFGPKDETYTLDVFLITALQAETGKAGK